MKSIITALLVWVVACMGFTSCTSTQRIIYFQKSDSLFQNPQKILQAYDMKIKPADRISVSISCSDPELLAPFAQNVTLGTYISPNGYSSNSGNNEAYQGYTVDKEGFVKLPVIGKIKAEGLTEEGLARAIERSIVASGYIKKPQVTVKFTNARVTVTGAVNKPGQVNLTSQRNSVVDVLAAAGDIADWGIKTNVKLFREVNGERKMYEFDMTQADKLFNSPAFYVQQNDVIYVEPNKSVVIRNTPFFTFWSASAGIVSVVISLATLAVSLSK